jgi:hypothetical protein
LPEGVPLTTGNEALYHGYIGCGRTFGTLFDVEGDPVTFVERPEAGGVDSRMMNENIGTVFLLDKAKSLTVIEPLHDTICHAEFLLRKRY